MQELMEQIRDQAVTYGPSLLGGLAVLVLGWVVARLTAEIVRKGLGKVSVDNKIANWLAGKDGPGQKPVPIEQWVAKGVFYLVMLFVIIAFLQVVKLAVIVDPLNALLKPVVAYVPSLLGGLLLGLAAWVVATVLRKVTARLLAGAGVDQKLGGAATEDARALPVSSAFSELVYWLVWLFSIPLILQALKMDSLLEPVNALLNKVCAFLPHLFSAAAIAVVGWFVARVAQRVVQGLLAGVGVDRLSEKWGLAPSLGKQRLSGVLGLVVYFLILVPVIISALGALQLEAVTRPATDMLAKILGVIPDIFGALVVMLIAVVVGRLVRDVVNTVLAGVGFNNILVTLGLAREAPPAGSRQSPAAWVGAVVFTLIVLLAAVTASDMLGFPSVGALIQDFIRFAAHILAGVGIFGLGLVLAQLAARGIRASDSAGAAYMATAARVVILALAGAMALRQTGLADEIVNLAFGLTLGAAAVAFAIAFGLGGREMAARTLERWANCCSRKPPEG